MVVVEAMIHEALRRQAVDHYPADPAQRMYVGEYGMLVEHMLRRAEVGDEIEALGISVGIGKHVVEVVHKRASRTGGVDRHIARESERRIKAAGGLERRDVSLDAMSVHDRAH